ncbi:rhodanese-like domain-containing protein [Pseudarthrobacter niigatensis]|uniref:rhodanese-like domain-containing protein n=1 Tax=Pseudarthrobacter niigatensis TaxID=369935 RepID=UPI0035216B27
MNEMPAIDRMLAESRVGLDRVHASDLGREMADGALVMETRPVDQRERDGDLQGAVVIDRNVLEWRLDPSSPHRLPIAGDPDRRIVVVCKEGYSSSLAAPTLQRLGLTRRQTSSAASRPGRRCGSPTSSAPLRNVNYRLSKRVEGVTAKGVVFPVSVVGVFLWLPNWLVLASGFPRVRAQFGRRTLRGSR